MTDAPTAPDSTQTVDAALIAAVESGIEYARECLATHDAYLGRTTMKNKRWAETMADDISHMERTLEMLRAREPNKEIDRK